MRFLRQSTATTVVVGPFLDRSDSLTPKTALADQSANGRLVKVGTGAAFAAASWAHDGLGGYAVGLSTAHTDTPGRLRLAFSDPTTFCPVWEDFTVLPGVMYDWLHGPSAPPAASDVATAIQTGSAPTWYAAPVDVSTNVTAIKAQTDKIAFDGSGNVMASAAVVADKAGYSLAQPFPTNFATLAIDTDGNVSTTGGGTGSAPTAGEVAAAVRTILIERGPNGEALPLWFAVACVFDALCGRRDTTQTTAPKIKSPDNSVTRVQHTENTGGDSVAAPVYDMTDPT